MDSRESRMAPKLEKPSSLTVPLLRAELDKRGLATTGLKAELVARLTEALEGREKGGDVDGDAEMADAPAEAAEAAEAEAEPSAARSKRGAAVAAATSKEAPEAAAKEPAKRPRRVGEGGGGRPDEAPLPAAAEATAPKGRMPAAEEGVAREHGREAAKGAAETAGTGTARAQCEALAADAVGAEAGPLGAEAEREGVRLSAAEEVEAAAMAAVAERAERRAAERAAAAAAAAAKAKEEVAPPPPPPPAPSAAAAAAADDDDEDEDAPLDSSHQQTHLQRNRKVMGAECPYLDTIDRSALDFDFAASGCSVSLAAANVYCCLVCGKFYAGKGPKTPANTHSLDAGHHVFMRIDGNGGEGGGGGEEGGGGSEEDGNRGKAFVLPEGYEVDDPCLDPIRAVLAPRFDRSRIAALDSDKRWARSLDGEPFVPGIVGLNSLGGRTDFANAVLQSLARVGPLRDFFLEPRNYAHAASSALVCRFGDFLRRAWNDRAFRGHVSPHELMVAVERASGGRFSPGGGGGGGGGGKRGKGGAQQRSASTDAAAFLVWLVNALHVDLVVPPGPTAPRGAAAARIAAGARSIITACFQGEVEVTTEIATVAGGGGGGSGGAEGGGGGETATTTTATSKFLVLALDPPPAPLYQDALEQNIIPQVALATLLSKYDGRTVTDDAKAGRRTLKVTRLPRFLLLHVRRFARNAFFAEKNPTIVNFPVKGLPLGELLRYKDTAREDDPYRYDLAANVAHEGPAAAGAFKAHVQRKADGTWFECCDLRVAETLPQVVALSEAYLQVWEKRHATAAALIAAGGDAAVPME